MKKGEIIEVEFSRKIDRSIHEHEIFLSFRDDWMATAFEDWFRNEGREEFASFCATEYEDWIEK